ncbi:hypothetical protein GCM10009821_02210 [Aeromicrobium halocynthiae]|uniref:Alpha/beta hydrolase n=1 Tax=Aeromicrobium halocynthiae TaxID=560557 RepID=A0ABN2VRJ9_9ACTN
MLSPHVVVSAAMAVPSGYYRPLVESFAAHGWRAQARSEEPERPVVLLGHSLGGQLGALVQARDDGADALVTIGAGVPWFRVHPWAGLPVPERSIDAYVDLFLDPDLTSRWTYRRAEAPVGGSTDHVAWFRRPEAVVEHVIDWWDSVVPRQVAGGGVTDRPAT